MYCIYIIFNFSRIVKILGHHRVHFVIISTIPSNYCLIFDQTMCLFVCFLFFCFVTIFILVHMLKYYILQCDPYFDTIGCAHPGCEPAYPTPQCVKKCVDGNQLWSESKHYSVNAYTIDSDPHSIMAEIYKNGPVEVDFTVYEVTSAFRL